MDSSTPSNVQRVRVPRPGHGHFAAARVDDAVGGRDELRVGQLLLQQAGVQILQRFGRSHDAVRIARDALGHQCLAQEHRQQPGGHAVPHRVRDEHRDVTLVDAEHVVHVAADPTGRTIEYLEAKRRNGRQFARQKIALEPAGQPHLLVDLAKVAIELLPQAVQVAQLPLEPLDQWGIAGQRADFGGHLVQARVRVQPFDQWAAAATHAQRSPVHQGGDLLVHQVMQHRLKLRGLAGSVPRIEQHHGQITGRGHHVRLQPAIEREASGGESALRQPGMELFGACWGAVVQQHA